MEAYYAARAPEYDEVYAKPERQENLRAVESWVTTIFSGRSVLEIACGTGYWTQFIAASASRVLALDAAPATLEIARRRCSRGSVEFVVGDAYAPPSSPWSDAAFAGFWFSHVPRARRREFLGSLNAALAPGARVVLLDNRFVAGSSSPLAEQDAQGDTWQVRGLRDGTRHRILKNFPPLAELQTLGAQVGRDVRIIEWQYFWAMEYVAE